MPKSPKYSFGSHTACVRKSSKAASSTQKVLFYLLLVSEYDKPEVTLTKPEIMDECGIGREAAMKALSFLREEGTLVPIAHFEGGRGTAVTYSIVDVGQGTHTPTGSKRAALTDQEKRDRRFKFLAAKHGAVEALRIMDE